MFRTDPESERHRGLSFILVPLDAPGITVRPIEKLNRKAAFAEVFFDDARVPSRTGWATRAKGWSVAMATAGFERGLMLRSPARFQNTARKLVELYRDERLGPADPRCAGMRRGALLDGRRGLHPQHLSDRVAPDGRRQDRRRGEPEQDLLVRARPAHARDGARAAGPRAELLPGAPAAERRRRAGSTATSSPCRVPSTPAPTRSSATSSPSESSACRGSSAWISSSAKTSAAPADDVRDFLVGRVHTRSRFRARALGDGPTGTLAGVLGPSSRRSGCPVCWSPEDHGGLGPGRDRSAVLVLLEKPAGPPSPSPSSSTAAVGAPLLHGARARRPRPHSGWPEDRRGRGRDRGRAAHARPSSVRCARRRPAHPSRGRCAACRRRRGRHA